MKGRAPAIGGLAGALVAMLVALLPSAATAQFFSPGPLARPHASLEGLDKCAKCHEEQKGLSARLCLDCHTELGPRVSKGEGFHGHLPAAKKQACQECHPDHRGLDFEMVEWEGGRDKFDHQRTGWPLKGGHASAKVHCDDCHKTPAIVEASVRRMLEKQPKSSTFLGLSQRCDTCHFDEHRGELGRECQKCHNETAWKPPASFNHQTAAFPLLGKHKDVACAKCHPSVTDEHFAAAPAFPKPRAATFMQMKPIDSKTCESCHEDPHKGSLGPACASCHSETSWKLIKTDKDRDTTFHDKTRFPLRGGHVGVNCRSCHGPFPGQPAKFKGLAFGACSDCHLDAHLGQLAVKPPAKAAPCESCHTVNAFSPPRYEREQHDNTKFPLEGAHAAVACRGCHPVDTGLASRIGASTRAFLKARKRPERFSLVLLHPAKSPTACAGCHQDVHLGQLSKPGVADNCATCHKTTSFSDLAFNHDRDSRFPLTGKHARTACAACHKPTPSAKGGAPVIRYKPLSMLCGSCHDDIHQGQFLVNALAVSSPAEGPVRDCDACHRTESFKKDLLFDHGDPRFTTFALEGKHAKVACAGCHREVTLAGGVRAVRYRPLPRDCEGCHTDFHHGEFRGFEP